MAEKFSKQNQIFTVVKQGLPFPLLPAEVGTPLYKLHRYVPPHRVGFLRRFGLKTGTHFAHFGLESGTVFEGSTESRNVFYRFNSK